MKQKAYEEIHLLVRGEVQGVCYRMETLRQANQLEITGWVRNLSSGEVEILAQGQPESLQKFVTWCHQGPPLAKVSEVTVKKPEPKKSYETFSIC